VSVVKRKKKFLMKYVNSANRLCQLFSVDALSAMCNYRQDAAKRQTAGIKFTHRPKNQVFAPQGRFVAPIHVKLGRADGHLVRLAEQNFTPIATGVGMRPPKYQKFPLFGKQSPRRGDSLDRFLKFLWAFIRPTILHQYFKFDMMRFTGYGVIAEKPRVGQLGRIFPCTL